MTPLYFVVWISSMGVNTMGITQGGLGNGNEQEYTIDRACATLETLRKREAGADLFRITQSRFGRCDFGCETDVKVEKMRCLTQTIPARSFTAITTIGD